MIRKFYRDIAQGRASLKDGVRSLSADEIAQAETDAARGRALAERHAQLPERIPHPATPAPEHKCYRVIRQFWHDGRVEFEDIGWFMTVAPVLSMLRREQGWACAITPQGKREFYNGQPMESRA